VLQAFLRLAPLRRFQLWNHLSFELECLQKLLLVTILTWQIVYFFT
jgi:hypothetical protein